MGAGFGAGAVGKAHLGTAIGDMCATAGGGVDCAPSAGVTTTAIATARQMQRGDAKP